ncbi:hypothetical protein Pyn_38557 [Prunus yedoensis var. nudiflora]|uniref:Uncharacterized protein n=1 Tax=Prunus yedoensis var. nudiflora TaxID=2094558 RepID=A0A314UQD8_PRUYE|nr:hypothetical protein Pyn_38557 [Prunus yedoensis var. nudiflora]
MEEGLVFVYSCQCLDIAMAKACWYFVEGELEFGVLPTVGGGSSWQLQKIGFLMQEGAMALMSLIGFAAGKLGLRSRRRSLVLELLEGLMLEEIGDWVINALA